MAHVRVATQSTARCARSSRYLLGKCDPGGCGGGGGHRRRSAYHSSKASNASRASRAAARQKKKKKKKREQKVRRLSGVLGCGDSLWGSRGQDVEKGCELECEENSASAAVYGGSQASGS